MREVLQACSSIAPLVRRLVSSLKTGMEPSNIFVLRGQPMRLGVEPLTCPRAWTESVRGGVNENKLVAPYLKALRWSIGSLAPIPSLSDQLPSPCHFAASRGHDLRGGRCVTPRVDITCRYSENTNEGRSLAPRLPPAHHQPVSSEPYLRRRGGMMVVSGDVAISGRASGSSGATRAYPPWTKRPTPSVPDRVRVC